MNICVLFAHLVWSSSGAFMKSGVNGAQLAASIVCGPWHEMIKRKAMRSFMRIASQLSSDEKRSLMEQFGEDFVRAITPRDWYMISWFITLCDETDLDLIGLKSLEEVARAECDRIRDEMPGPRECSQIELLSCVDVSLDEIKAAQGIAGSKVWTSYLLELIGNFEGEQSCALNYANSCLLSFGMQPVSIGGDADKSFASRVSAGEFHVSEDEVFVKTAPQTSINHRSHATNGYAATVPIKSSPNRLDAPDSRDRERRPLRGAGTHIFASHAQLASVLSVLMLVGIVAITSSRTPPADIEAPDYPGVSNTQSPEANLKNDFEMSNGTMGVFQGGDEYFIKFDRKTTYDFGYLLQADKKSAVFKEFTRNQAGWIRLWHEGVVPSDASAGDSEKRQFEIAIAVVSDIRLPFLRENGSLPMRVLDELQDDGHNERNLDQSVERIRGVLRQQADDADFEVFVIRRMRINY